MIDWNLGDILDAVEPAMPQDAPALIHGDRIVTWPEMSARSNNIARALRQRGACDGAKVAFYMRNRPEYGELMAACFKGRLTHVNINYRYRAEEVFYIFHDSDSEVIVYSSEFRECIVELKDRLEKVHTFVEIGDPSEIASFASPYETLAEKGDGSALGIERSPDDLLFIYTGGTTGMPKGVLWRQVDCLAANLDGRDRHGVALPDVAAFVARARKRTHNIVLPAPPFMHGAGCQTALSALCSGNTVVISNVPDRLDTDDLLDTIARERITMLLLIGDAYGRPLAQAARARDHDFSSLSLIVNTGAIMSPATKAELLRLAPGARTVDALGASESGPQAIQVTGPEDGTDAASFRIADDAVVLNADMTEELAPGHDGLGWLAKSGAVPLGYLNDPEKTAKTFPTVNGTRYVIPGDRVRLLAGGILEFHGRESFTINSGGEKIFAEEVEQAIKHHPGVADVVVTGRPSERWGQEVVAIIQPANGTMPNRAELLAEAERHIARFKLPKAFLFLDAIQRGPSGKTDAKWARARAGDAT